MEQDCCDQFINISFLLERKEWIFFLTDRHRNQLQKERHISAAVTSWQQQHTMNWKKVRNVQCPDRITATGSRSALFMNEKAHAQFSLLISLRDRTGGWVGAGCRVNVVVVAVAYCVATWPSGRERCDKRNHPLLDNHTASRRIILNKSKVIPQMQLRFYNLSVRQSATIMLCLKGMIPRGFNAFWRRTWTILFLGIF